MDAVLLDGGSFIRDRQDRGAATAAEQTEHAYRRYSTPLRRYAYARTRDATVAEDLVHDAFLRLSREIHAGRRPDDVAPWLHRVVANLVVSRGRRLQVAVRHAAQAAARDSTLSAESVVLDGELARAIGEALGTLTPIDRRVVLLAAHGYRGPEIATLVGRSDAAARTLLCRARARLRVQLAAWDAG